MSQCWGSMLLTCFLSLNLLVFPERKSSQAESFMLEMLFHWHVFFMGVDVTFLHIWKGETFQITNVHLLTLLELYLSPIIYFLSPPRYKWIIQFNTCFVSLMGGGWSHVFKILEVSRHQIEAEKHILGEIKDYKCSKGGKPLCVIVTK